jgi:hypothetical protein
MLNTPTHSFRSYSLNARHSLQSARNASILQPPTSTRSYKRSRTALAESLSESHVELAWSGATFMMSLMKLATKPFRLTSPPPPLAQPESSHKRIRFIDTSVHRLSQWAFDQADVHKTGFLTAGQVYGGILALHWQMTRFAGGLVQPFLGPPPEPCKVMEWCHRATFASNQLVGRTEFRRVVTRVLVGEVSHVIVTLLTVLCLMPVLRHSPVVRLVWPTIPMDLLEPVMKGSLLIWQHIITTVMGFYLVPSLWKPVDRWLGDRFLPRSPEVMPTFAHPESMQPLIATMAPPLRPSWAVNLQPIWEWD